MNASKLDRIAAAVLLLFASGHTVGLRRSDPIWGVDTLLGSLDDVKGSVDLTPFRAKFAGNDKDLQAMEDHLVRIMLGYFAFGQNCVSKQEQDSAALKVMRDFSVVLGTWHPVEQSDKLGQPPHILSCVLLL